jgi:hypothetical protein
MIRQKPIIAKPPGGGRLLSAISAENATIYNYTIKRDFRRVLDREIRSEGLVEFCPKSFTVDDVPSIVMPDTADPITLVVMLRHPNGRTAIIVGTAQKIWRYYGVENPLYFDAGYYDPDYYDEDSVAWKEIGSGFSASGRRWECATTDGYLILNNAADLPVTYRLTDDAVIPIYELRELAVASVGTIFIQNSHLVCCDIRQIKEDKFLELMAPIDSAVDGFVDGITSSGAVTATINSGVAGVAGNVITASSAAFNSGAGFTGMEIDNRTIRMLNGTTRRVASVNSPTEAVLDGNPALCEPGTKFFIARSEFFTDYYLDYALQPDRYSVLPNLNIADGYYNLSIWWDSGASGRLRIIQTDGISGDEFFLLNSDTPIASSPLQCENPKSYKSFTVESHIDRLQNRVIHSLPGQPRRFGATVTGRISPQSDTITLDYHVKSIPITGSQIIITGMKSGNLVADVAYYDGLRILVKDSAIRKFYQDLNDAVTAALQVEADAQALLTSTLNTIEFAEKALADASQALSEADNPDDADLNKAVSDASAGLDAARKAKIDAEAALLAATKAREEAEDKADDSEEVEIQLADSLSSFSRLEDLQHDGAAILKGLAIKTVGLIFTETAIFISRYIPTAGTFSYQLIEIPESAALFYRNTPIVVNGEWILYAAENQFCRFDLTGQMPREVDILDGCDDIFFSQAVPENMEDIFTADNVVTKEVFICFPSSSSDKSIRLDYSQGTVSTSAIACRSATSAIFPGTTRSIFLIGADAGKVLRYGLVAGGSQVGTGTASKTANVVTAPTHTFTEFDIGKSIKFANGSRFGITKWLTANTVEVAGTGNVTAQAFTIESDCHHMLGVGYKSVLQSGSDAFRNEAFEKRLSRYTLMLSSFSPNHPLTVVIRSGRNINEVVDKITVPLTPPETLIPIILSDYLLGDRVEIDGMNNPLEITSRIYHVSGANTNSFGRRAVDG